MSSSSTCLNPFPQGRPQWKSRQPLPIFRLLLYSHLLPAFSCEEMLSFVSTAALVAKFTRQTRLKSQKGNFCHGFDDDSRSRLLNHEMGNDLRCGVVHDPSLRPKRRLDTPKASCAHYRHPCCICPVDAISSHDARRPKPRSIGLQPAPIPQTKHVGGGLRWKGLKAETKC